VMSDIVKRRSIRAHRAAVKLFVARYLHLEIRKQSSAIRRPLIAGIWLLKSGTSAKLDRNAVGSIL
jgi:hypothetical protein